ncbi:MAG: MFS transporter, partial [Synergistaceae bacterium]|nr:MFS transporter [Synergistaceae bacterium]
MKPPNSANSRMFFAGFVGRAVFAFLFAASIAFFIFYGDTFLRFGRLGFVEIDSPALVVRDAPGNIYIADSGRKRVIRVGITGKADFLMTAQRNHFSRIYGLAVDAAGNIFVLSTTRDERSRRITSEIVQKHLPNGRFVEEFFRVDHEIPTFNRSIAGLVRNAEGGVSFITLEDRRFVLHSHISGEKTETAYDFPMALKIFNSFDVGGGGKEKEKLVLFTTRHGRIYKASEAGVEQIFASDASTPWDVAVGDDGVFYFTDLKRRSVYSLTPNGETEAIYSDPYTIYYRVSAKSGLVAISEHHVIDLGVQGNPVFEEFGVSGYILAMRLCSWLASLILLAGCIWGVVLLARFVIKKNDFVSKFSAAFIAGVLFVTVVFCLMVTKDITNRMTREMKSRLTNVANLVAMQVPSEAFARLNSVTDFMNEDYVLVSSTIEIIMSHAEFSEMYCVLYKILDGAIAEVLDSDNNNGIVNFPYDWPLEGSDEMEILSTGQHKTYILPSWIDGGIIFSLCPVYNDAGEAIGLVEIGSSLAAFQRENMNLVVNIFLNVISISVAIIIVVIELLVFMDGRRKMLPAVNSSRVSSGFRVPLEMMRGAVFLVYFITNISTSFLPIYARSLILEAGISLPFPTEFLIAVPISADVLFGAIAALLGDWFVRKFGLRWVAITGGLFIVGGTCLAFMFYNFFTLVAGFALCGFGCGLILLLANLQIAGEEDSSEKDRGFAGTAAAMSSGINAGVVFGAFLTNWLSHQAVLGMAALVSLPLLAFSCAYMTKLQSP